MRVLGDGPSTFEPWLVTRTTPEQETSVFQTTHYTNVRTLEPLQVEASETFVASRGCFTRFKPRNNLHNMHITGGAASGRTKLVADFPANPSKTIIERGNYHRELVFNDKTCPILEKNANIFYHEEKRAPGYRAAKYRLLGDNASGGFKSKPLLIYHSKNQRVMKGISKLSLPIIWESNKKNFG
ncbi:tigger transposable element-derived protein 1 [Trichonephila clavipes]|nr:tigger transposable element-derived protein 1 [Trichonephila clavipes]